MNFHSWSEVLSLMVKGTFAHGQAYFSTFPYIFMLEWNASEKIVGLYFWIYKGVLLGVYSHLYDQYKK